MTPQLRLIPICILSLAVSGALAQTPAAKSEMGAYRIPFGTEGNVIELTVANETTQAYDQIEVRAAAHPSWVEITMRNDEPASTIDPASDRLYSFVFSVDDSAPTEEVEKLEFEVRSRGERIATRTIDISVELPNELVLRGNYPNPFNASTTIGFVQPEDGNVTLDVFDELGRQVDRLSKDSAKRGQQTLSWNAAGRASGVYFYRLRLNSESGVRETRLGKMLLVK